MMKKVAIVNSKSFGKITNAYDELKKYFHVEFVSVPRDINGKALSERLADFDFLVISATPYYSSDFFKYNQRISVIVRHGIGIDNVDVEAATIHGVLIVKVPGHYEREAVAEHTIGLIIAALRKIKDAHASLMAGTWEDRIKYIGRELSSKTIGVIGFGNIGRRVAEILTKGFKARVIVYDPYVADEEIRKEGAEPREFDELLGEADIITLHCPLIAETKYLINKDSIRKMRENVIIINTARGQLIETKSLIDALIEKKIAYAALDVFEEEPIPPEHPLLKLDNVLLTPHIAAYTEESLIGMDEFVVKSLKNILNGIIPDGTVNGEVVGKSSRLVKILQK